MSPFNAAHHLKSWRLEFVARQANTASRLNTSHWFLAVRSHSRRNRLAIGGTRRDKPQVPCRRRKFLSLQSMNSNWAGVNRHFGYEILFISVLFSPIASRRVLCSIFLRWSLAFIPYFPATFRPRPVIIFTPSFASFTAKKHLIPYSYGLLSKNHAIIFFYLSFLSFFFSFTPFSLAF